MVFVIRVFRLWLGILIALYAVYLAVNNTERMVIQLPPFISHVSLPVYVIGASFLLAGCGIAVIFLGLDLVKKSLTIHQLKKRLRQYEPMESFAVPATGTARGKFQGKPGKESSDSIMDIQMERFK